MFLKKYYPQGKFELYGAKNQFLWGSSFDLDQWFFLGKWTIRERRRLKTTFVS